jgi:hypothetical protein
MNWTGWSSPVEKASCDIWVYESEGEEVEHFEQRWGSFDSEVLQKVLDEGNGQEKAFAILTLGLLALPDVNTLLFPFLNSPERIEQWASAIALGRRKDERVFSRLQEMLSEDIFEYDSLVDKTIEETVSAAHKQWGRKWREHVDQDILEIWKNAIERFSEYGRYLYLRSTVALVLGSWNNPHAIPALRDALHTAWIVEQQSTPFSARKEICSDGWHVYQDRLAYALGQLGAFGMLLNLDTPADRLSIALVYLIIGSLQLSAEDKFVPELTQYLFSSLADPVPFFTVVEERFGWSREELNSFLLQFKQDCHKRLS